MLIVNNKALKITNKWLNPVAGSGPTPPTPPTYYHVYTSATNGTIAAVPVSGISGTTVTLSNTPDTGYEFDSYSITGATLYDTNKFDINNSDVNVVGNFIASQEPVYIVPADIQYDIPDIGTYAGWYKSDLDAAGGIYTSTYKFVSDNWPSGLEYFWSIFYDSNWNKLNTAYYAYASDNYEFSFSDIINSLQYNSTYYFHVHARDANGNDLRIPSDIKLQLLS